MGHLKRCNLCINSASFPFVAAGMPKVMSFGDLVWILRVRDGVRSSTRQREIIYFDHQQKLRHFGVAN